MLFVQYLFEMFVELIQLVKSSETCNQQSTKNITIEIFQISRRQVLAETIDPKQHEHQESEDEENQG